MRKLPQQQRTQAAVLTGADLREHRRRLGISQAELARQLHYSRGYVCNLEHGRAGIPLSLAKAALALLSELQGQLEAEREHLFVVSNTLQRRRA